MSNRYKLRGVSSDKEDVHEAIKTHDKGLFPQAFCKILPDYIGNSDEHALIVHSDGLLLEMLSWMELLLKMQILEKQE